MKNLGKLLFGFLLALIFLSCAGHVGMYQYTHVDNNPLWVEIYPVYIDNSFGEADKVAIGRALEQWNFAFNSNARFQLESDKFDMSQEGVLRQVQDGKAFVIFKVNGNNPIVDASDAIVRQYKPGASGKDLSWGFTTSVGDHKIYLVRDRMGNGDVFYITMHELGHALGAQHTADGLMYKFYSPERFQCVDRLAIEQVALYHHWDDRTVNYCVLAAPVTPAQASVDLGEDQQGGQTLVNVIRR
jgi:Matrixin